MFKKKKYILIISSNFFYLFNEREREIESFKRSLKLNIYLIYNHFTFI